MMADAETASNPLILLTGGTGYVAGRLISLLEKQGARLRCLARNQEKLRPRVQPSTEIVQGDVLDRLRWIEPFRASTLPTTSST
jgi:uncharacterized protein YbjT (DUF2867 family)